MTAEHPASGHARTGYAHHPKMSRINGARISAVFSSVAPTDVAFSATRHLCAVRYNPTTTSYSNRPSIGPFNISQTSHINPSQLLTPTPRTTLDTFKSKNIRTTPNAQLRTHNNPLSGPSKLCAPLRSSPRPRNNSHLYLPPTTPINPLPNGHAALHHCCCC